MSRTEEFEQLRPLLFSIAYRVLGSVGEAEDAVQQTWLRYYQIEAAPDSPRALLSTMVTRVSIDVLRSARWRREVYVGPGSRSRCSMIPMRTRSAQLSWPTRCRWRRCCCSNG